MKVLIVTTYIYREEWPEFTKNRTGFGMMVNNIFESVSEKTDTYLFSHVITEGHGKVIKHTWRDVFESANIRDWLRGFKYFLKYKQGLRERMKYFYYALNAGCLRQVIRTIRPNIIHIQGIGIQIKPFIEVCDEEKIPYIVTLHGLIGLDETVGSTPWDKQMERDFLIEAEKEGIPVTVISTGIKKRIEDNYLHHEAKNITVVCNGTRMPYDEQLIVLDRIDLRKQFSLENEKIVVVMGAVCERKNQWQILRVIGKVTTPCRVFLCGADTTNGLIQKKIKEAGLSNKVHVLGFLPIAKVEQILEQADLHLVVSKDEGFGFSIIEACYHGVPTVVFSDLVVGSAMIDERALVKVEHRDDTALARGIEAGLSRHWDKSWIKEYAKLFPLDKIVEIYNAEYKQLLVNGGNISIAKICDYLAVQRKRGYKILSYVGNITTNKNQIELVKHMSKLQVLKTIAVFAGREADAGNVRNYVIEKKLENSVVLVGFCSEMDSIWKNISLNVFLSKNDGFGLSVIEGYMRGIPSIMYMSLDAFHDVNGIGMYGLKDGGSFINLYSDIIRQKHPFNEIIQDAKRFSLNVMRDNYIKEYMLWSK